MTDFQFCSSYYTTRHTDTQRDGVYTAIFLLRSAPLDQRTGYKNKTDQDELSKKKSRVLESELARIAADISTAGGSS